MEDKRELPDMSYRRPAKPTAPSHADVAAVIEAGMARMGYRPLMKAKDSLALAEELIALFGR